MQRRGPTLGEPREEERRQTEECLGRAVDCRGQDLSVEPIPGLLVGDLAGLCVQGEPEIVAGAQRQTERGVPAGVAVVLGEALRYDGAEGAQVEEQVSSEGGEVGPAVAERRLADSHGTATACEVFLEGADTRSRPPCETVACRGCVGSESHAQLLSL